MKNAVGRELPEQVEGYGRVIPFAGVFAHSGEHTHAAAKVHSAAPGESKLLPSLTEAIRRSGLRSGMTVSFHHHLRNGDRVLNAVMAAIDALGIRDLRLAASGIFPCHAPLVDLIERGVVTQIVTDTFNPGPVARAVSAGMLQKPAVLMTHGGRPRAIACGELHIDVAFLAAPTCDTAGNCNGTQGPSACGYLSYAYPDAQYADCVVAVTDHLVPYPACPAEIGEELVDYVVQIDSIGDPNGIVSGSTKITDDPVRLHIAEDAARVIDAAGMLKEGMSLQTGASGTALAVADRVRTQMLARGITGSFGLGGIHAYFVQMLEEGLLRALLDVQCFDREAIRSAARNAAHMPISASRYADPWAKDCVVNHLDTVILGATEIDTDFNVNVVTGSNGVILGASGGHSDCAAGAALTVVVANLTRKQFCVVRKRVTTVTTPGESIDVFVCEHGVAINPRRRELFAPFAAAGLPLKTMDELRAIGEDIAGAQHTADVNERIVAVVEYRDGSVIDLVRQVNNI